MMVSADDYVEIANLLGHYCHAIDSGEASEWARCFTEDGKFYIEAEKTYIQGAAQLEDFARSFYARSNGAMRHQISNLACKYGSDKNVVNAKFYNNVTRNAVPVLMTICDFVFARTEKGWKVKQNTYKSIRAQA